MADSDRTTGEPNTVGAKARGWQPSRGFWFGMAGVAVFAGVLAAAGALASTSEPEPVYQVPTGPAPTVQVSYAPRKTTPPDDFTANISGGPVSASTPSDAAEAASVQAVAAPAAVTTDGTASAVSESPTPVASSWSQSPVFEPPAPAAPLSPAAKDLVAMVNAEYGFTIATEGQDWGDDEGEQLANVGAVVSAWQQLPLQVTSGIVQHPQGPLTILSNTQGRTLGGVQPHGPIATSFYTNSDHYSTGYAPTHQIVLATGAGVSTVLHEMMHAYQMRNVTADNYVATVLTEEMQSFMDAAGWRMLVSKDDLVANLHVPWETVNSYFAYEGPAEDAGANPIEDFAHAGALFFGGDSGSRPDLAAYWAWFGANLA